MNGNGGQHGFEQTLKYMTESCSRFFSLQNTTAGTYWHQFEKHSVLDDNHL